MQENEAGPFRELIPWDDISLRLSPQHVPILHKALANVSQARVVAMRRNMARWWPRLLWPALDAREKASTRGHAQRAFAEGRTRDDAFTTLVEVLRRRLQDADKACA